MRPTNAKLTREPEYFIPFSRLSSSLFSPCVTATANLLGAMTNIYLPRPGLPKSYEDAAMNDKLLKCITMMSHEIKAIYRSALCEKYGNNIALASKTALCI